MENWIDATNYNRTKTDRIPDSWELKTEYIRIWVSKGHIDYPNTWVYSCYSIGVDAKSLKLPNDAPPELAQKKALAWVRDRLQRMLNSLNDEK